MEIYDFEKKIELLRNFMESILRKDWPLITTFQSYVKKLVKN